MLPRKALFIERRVLHDRDLPRVAPRRTDFAFPRRLVEALREAHRAGLVLFVVSNEDDVAFGRIRPEAVARYAAGLTRALAAKGVPVARVFQCPYHPKGKGSFRRESVHRFPNIGMMMAARHEFGVDPTASWLVGHTTLALLAGARAGCLTARVHTPDPKEEEVYFVEPDHDAPDLLAAMKAIVGHEIALTR